MNRSCPKCGSVMRGETHPIPKEISLSASLPNNIKKRANCTTFVCDFCGYLQVFVT